ncbi:MAG TPA: DUF3570 domain-containing protein [Polyangiaceae bacterium]|jgi:hypothetical protein|nr:DUF3570 domain-containing protein [Polyangiaceae bacterium]
MRLSRLIAIAMTAGTVARADDIVARVATEVAGYADTDHVAVLTPSVTGRVASATAGWSVEGSYLVDVISAASVDIVSTASQRWTEVRHEGTLSAAYKPHTVGGAVLASVSSEPDYLAFAVGGTAQADFDERNVSVLVGYAYAHDTIGRTGTPFSVFSHTLEKHSVQAVMTRVVDRATLLSLALDMKFELGDPSKPYRYVPTFTSGVASSIPVGASLQVVSAMRTPERPLEQLPLERDRFALTAKLARRLRRSTVRVDARVYGDTWNLLAFTTDVRWLADLGQRWRIGPHARYHVQSAASFWKLAYVSDGTSVPAFRTGDRELGPLMSLTGGGRARYAFGSTRDPDAWALTADVDVTYTGFFDDLYITKRLSTLVSLAVEARW